MAKQTVKIRYPSGLTEAVELEVVRTILLAVDCGCWGHAGYGNKFVIIMTKGAAYIRRADAEHHFATIDQSGPITAAIEALGL